MFEKYIDNQWVDISNEEVEELLIKMYENPNYELSKIKIRLKEA